MPKSILGRTYDDQYDPQNRTSDGKRHLLSAKGKQYMNEKINKQLASVASQLGQKVNAMEQRMDEKFRELNQTVKYYFSS